MAFPICLTVVVLLALVTTITGRLHVALLGPTWLRSLRPLEAVVSCLMGTAWWTVLLTALSSRGGTIPFASAFILAAHGLALGVVAWRRRLDVFRPRGGIGPWTGLLVPALAVVLVGLLPVLRKGSFATDNDSLTYCAFAQWLQDHSYGAATAWRADEPLAFYPTLYQGARATLAPAFLLAGTQAIARFSSPLLVYPALSTFGLALAVLGLLVAGRWMLGWPTRWLAPLGLGVAALPGPLVWAHHAGFLAQTLGIPALLGVLLILARCRPARRWRAREAALLGLFTAGLASTYLALLPVALGAEAAWGLAAMGRARTAGRARRLVASLFAFAVVLLTLLAAQGVSVTHGLGFLGSAVVGFPVRLSSVGFWQLALGARMFAATPLDSWAEALRTAHLWLAPAYAVLALIGAYRIAKTPRAGSLSAAALVLALGVAYFALWAHDPWTGERGHTWNLFKLAQWTYPLVLLAELHGLVVLAGRRSFARVIPCLAAIPLGALAIQWAGAGVLGGSLEAFVGAPRPLDGWPRLRRAFAELPPGALLVTDGIPDTSPHLPIYLGLLAYPRRLAGDWTGSQWIPPDPERRFEKLWAALAEGLPRREEDRVLPLVTGLHGFVGEGVERLGGAIGLVRDGTRPQMLALLTPSDEAPGPRGCVWIGRARTRALLFSPQAVSATLEMEAIPGLGAGGLGSRLIVDTAAAAFEVAVDPSSSRIRVPIRLDRGIGRAEIRFPGLEREVADRRRLCVARFNLASVQVEPPAAGPLYRRTGGSP
jgi:hypothetical protein